jgi:F0F1-type ATP synthase delta subunit
MEAQRINQAIKEEYKFLNDIADDDTDFINNKTIIAETKKDLENEGLANISSIVAASIVIDNSDELADDEGIEDEEPKTAEQEMSDLITDGALKRVKRTEAGETIYEETTVADGATPKQYIVKDDKIYEYANGQAGTEEVFPENIKSAYDEVVQAKAEAEAEKAKQEAKNKTAQQEQTLSSEAYEHGKLVADYLDDCCTNGSQEEEIAFRIEKINNGDARYTYNFLKAIYENYDDNEGFFEKLEDDCSDSNVSVELRITFLEKILEAAGREEFGSMDYDTSP